MSVRRPCAHPNSRVKFDGGSLAVVCNGCNLIVTHVSRNPVIGTAPASELEYGWNTGSETTLIGDLAQIEAWAAVRGWEIGRGDWGSRIMQRRRAGSWTPAEPVQEVAS